MDDLAKQSSKISIHSNAQILEHHAKGYMQTVMCHLSKQFLCSLFKTVAKWVHVLKYCKEQVGPTSSKKWSMHTWCYFLDLSGIVFPFIIIISSLPPLKCERVHLLSVCQENVTVQCIQSDLWAKKPNRGTE